MPEILASIALQALTLPALLALLALRQTNHQYATYLLPEKFCLVFYILRILHILQKCFLTLIRLALLKVVFSGVGQGQLDPLPPPFSVHISRETNLISI